MSFCSRNNNEAMRTSPDEICYVENDRPSFFSISFSNVNATRSEKTNLIKRPLATMAFVLFYKRDLADHVVCPLRPVAPRL